MAKDIQCYKGTAGDASAEQTESWTVCLYEGSVTMLEAKATTAVCVCV